MSNSPSNIRSKRPLSPHLSIYKPQMSSVLSIFHRATGVALYFSFMIISWALIYFAAKYLSNGAPCECMTNLLHSNLVKVALMGISLCGFYHLCTGVRHLFWDIGYGYSIKVMDRTGYLAVICALTFTVLFWVM